MGALDELRAEHETILKVLTAVEAAARDAGPNGLSEAYIANVLDFIWTFVERNHHGKEERALFPRLRDDPFLENVGRVLHAEHEQGAAFVSTIERVLDEDRPTEILMRELFAYVSFLRNHIRRENEMIFDAIENALDDKTVGELLIAFREIEEEALGAADFSHLFVSLEETRV